MCYISNAWDKINGGKFEGIWILYIKNIISWDYGTFKFFLGNHIKANSLGFAIQKYSMENKRKLAKISSNTNTTRKTV